MKTHKNPALRGSSKVPATSSPAKSGAKSSAYTPKPFQASRTGGAVTRPVIMKKPPKKELLGQKKWIVVGFWMECFFSINVYSRGLVRGNFLLLN
jgi:hypothetical protein